MIPKSLPSDLIRGWLPVSRLREAWFGTAAIQGAVLNALDTLVLIDLAASVAVS